MPNIKSNYFKVLDSAHHVKARAINNTGGVRGDEGWRREPSGVSKNKYLSNHPKPNKLVKSRVDLAKIEKMLRNQVGEEIIKLRQLGAGVSTKNDAGNYPARVDDIDRVMQVRRAPVRRGLDLVDAEHKKAKYDSSQNPRLAPEIELIRSACANRVGSRLMPGRYAATTPIGRNKKVWARTTTGKLVLATQNADHVTMGKMQQGSIFAAAPEKLVSLDSAANARLFKNNKGELYFKRDTAYTKSIDGLPAAYMLPYMFMQDFDGHGQNLVLNKDGSGIKRIDMGYAFDILPDSALNVWHGMTQLFARDDIPIHLLDAHGVVSEGCNSFIRSMKNGKGIDYVLTEHLIAQGFDDATAAVGHNAKTSELVKSMRVDGCKTIQQLITRVNSHPHLKSIINEIQSENIKDRKHGLCVQDSDSEYEARIRAKVVRRQAAAKFAEVTGLVNVQAIGQKNVDIINDSTRINDTQITHILRDVSWAYIKKEVELSLLRPIARGVSPLLSVEAKADIWRALYRLGSFDANLDHNMMTIPQTLRIADNQLRQYSLIQIKDLLFHHAGRQAEPMQSRMRNALFKASDEASRINCTDALKYMTIVQNTMDLYSMLHTAAECLKIPESVVDQMIDNTLSSLKRISTHDSSIQKKITDLTRDVAAYQYDTWHQVVLEKVRCVNQAEVKGARPVDAVAYGCTFPNTKMCDIHAQPAIARRGIKA